MKKTMVPLALAALLVTAASCSKTPKEETSSTTTETSQQTAQTSNAPVARGEAAMVHTSFHVEAVDADKRTITLKDEHGNTGVYDVGPQVQRLNEIKAGDTIHAEYTVGAVAELREPTAEEKSAPLTEVTGAARASTDEPPAGGVGRVVKAVASIESLDPAAQSATVKGPENGMVTVHVEDPTVFQSLKVGQPVVVTFAEKLVLSVQPGAKS